MINQKRSLFILLLLVPTAGFAAAKALLDRDQINMSEAVNVEISTDKYSNDTPNFSSLNADFEVASTGKTVAVEMINGHVRQETRWVISLIPKHAGALTIPPIRIGSEKTQPLQLTVLDKPIALQKTDEFFIESTVEPKEAYWQQPVLYTVRIWASKPLSSAQFMPPSIKEGGTITPIDKQTNNMSYRGGRQYEVVEKRYLISPDKVGTLTIQPPSLRGIVFDNNQARQFFTGGDPQTVQLAGKELPLTVKAKPASWQSAWWLPATRLTIKDEWSQDLNNWHVGVPLTRTITIQGTGITAAQLPDIKMDSLTGINTYPDKTESKDSFDQHTILGTRQIKVALVPTQAGQWQLPAIKLPWWNVKTNKMEVAEIPAVSLNILPEAGASPAATKPTTPIEEKNQSQTQSSSMTSKNNTALKNDTTFSAWQWLVFLLATLLLLSLITILSLWRKLNSKNSKAKQEPSFQDNTPQTFRQAINTIKKCCANKNSRATINATITWARLYWPTSNIASLQDVANLIHDPQFTEQVSKLLAVCYGSTKEDWQAGQYWQSIEQFVLNSAKLSKKPEDPLPSLFV